MVLPLFLTAPNSSTSALDPRRQLHGSESKRHPNARMRLHDDLLINGYYTTRLWIGTPPQMFALIVDTGSTVTYVPCSTCEQCGRHQDPKFQPDLSSTYQPVKCSMDCNCDNDRMQCVYERQYAEMSTSSGVLGEDLISFGNQSELAPQRAIFGCENVETGDLYSQHADGIMGLGRGDLSIMDQLVDKNVVSDSFSLCYGGMNVGGGAMVLGGISPPSDMVFAQSDPVRSDVSQLSKNFPVVDMVFGNGQKYSLSPENYMFRHSKVRGAYCLGIFQNGKDPTTLLGGIIVRNTLVMYDREQTKVGFWKTNCAELWERLQISMAPPPINSTKSVGPTGPPSVSQHNLPPGGFQIALITIAISFNISYEDMKPHLAELAGLIAHELDVNTSQIHLLNFTSFGNDSLSRWVITPRPYADYFSNATTMSIIGRLAEHHMQLPDTFGSYKLIDWNVEPPPKRSWWKQYYMVMGLVVLLTLLLGLSIFGIFLIWKKRQQQSVHSYKPVDVGVPEQELQPL
ncbi:unnamed protein product [Trifolium pratense]|uniref:Uncharacterized protein n=1 Tax=Trifolium pratense TaxID=57577 RepID=A0ACB0ITT5_TRIPR|nr:unnamed protein product [Trifolium pratense]